MERIRERKILRDLSRNASYFSRNYKRFQKSYPNQYLVIGSGKLLVHEKNVKAVDNFIKNRAIEKTRILIKRMPRHGVSMFY